MTQDSGNAARRRDHEMTEWERVFRIIDDEGDERWLFARNFTAAESRGD